MLLFRKCGRIRHGRVELTRFREMTSETHDLDVEMQLTHAPGPYYLGRCFMNSAILDSFIALDYYYHYNRHVNQMGVPFS